MVGEGQFMASELSWHESQLEWWVINQGKMFFIAYWNIRYLSPNLSDELLDMERYSSMMKWVHDPNPNSSDELWSGKYNTLREVSPWPES